MYLKRLTILGLLIIVALGAGFSVLAYRMIFSPNTAFEADAVDVYIPTGSNYEMLRRQLMQLVKDIENFDFTAQRKGYVDKVKPGRYRLRRGMNSNQLVNSLRGGNLAVNVTFNNQETLALLAGRISNQIEADSLSLLKAMTDSTFLLSRNMTPDQALSLYIPNTYKFYWNTSAVEFRNRMAEEFDRFWTENRKELAKKLDLNPLEVIALASIVQKETAKVDERPRVAGVYLNRLKRNIALQADPTVIFAIKHHSGNFEQVIKRVLYKDLELDSPYNTYKYSGLPPGPIFMPDISSIDAVLNPEAHNYIFFVADTSNFGYHIFAETLAQHNRNKGQYHRWVNANKILR
jgi:UPF0755 protein